MQGQRMEWQHWQVGSERLEQLLRRTEAMRPLLRRALEEEITTLVNLPAERLVELHQLFREQHQLADESAEAAWLEQRSWTPDDLQMHLARPEALNRFAQQRFGPGLEDTFLQRKNDLDTVVYSLLRVQDHGLARELWIQLSEGEITFAEAASRHSDGPEATTKGVIGPRKNDLDTVVYSLLRVQDHGLARELWIQLSEGEITFAEAASRHSDGPEATTKGVIGPVALGQLQPELAERLRSLRQGELREPMPAGPWWVLLRLEQLTPAKLDEAMRQRLLQEQLSAWLEQRCDAVLRGDAPDPLHYDHP